jgi:peptide/nickel transport system permease protein
VIRKKRQRDKPVSVVRMALRSRRTQLGLGLSGTVILVSVFGPLLSPHDPQEFVTMPFAKSGGGFTFGGDNLGRDVMSQFLNGGWRLLMLSAIATFLGVALGAFLGIVAGYNRRRLDELIMRSGDVALAFPQLLLALLFISVTGPNLFVVVILVAIGHAPRVARVMRGATLAVAERDFVSSAAALGMPSHRVVLQEILPNVSGPLAVEAGLRLTYSIGVIAGLSFLGLGVQPPTPDWGLMINENRIALTIQPWPVLLPVIAIALVTIGMNLVSDGLARANAGVDRGVDA